MCFLELTLVQPVARWFPPSEPVAQPPGGSVPGNPLTSAPHCMYAELPSLTLNTVVCMEALLWLLVPTWHQDVRPLPCERSERRWIQRNLMTGPKFWRPRPHAARPSKLSRPPPLAASSVCLALGMSLPS